MTRTPTTRAPTTRPRTLIALAVLAMPFASCGDTRHGASRAGTNSQWTVRIGSSGGFTGGGAGHLVHSDGRVQEWSRTTAQDGIALRDVGRAGADAVKVLREAMTDPALVSLAQREVGNVTSFLEWSEGPTLRHYGWAARQGEPGLPAPLARALAAAEAAVASAERNGDRPAGRP